MKKKFLAILLMLTLFVTPVFADEVAKTAECKSGSMIADNSVNYNDCVVGSTAVAGNIVSYDGTTDGIAFIAGNSVTVKGSSEYGFIAGNNVDVTGEFEKDVFIAGNIVTITANVGRDIFAGGSNVTLTGTVDRNAFLTGQNVILDNVTINGDVKIEAESITIKDTVKINGKLTYSAEVDNISDKANIGEKEKVEPTYVETYDYLDTLKERLVSYISLLLVFVVLALAIPTSIKGVADDKLSFTQIITYIGYALVFLILVPMASMILLVTGIGLPLALMAIAIYIAAIYLAYAYMGYYIGKKIWLKNKKEENVLLEGLIGITILYVIALIPGVGPIVSFLARLCGLGIIIFKFKK
ncbi:MAG: hypothetical protein IJ565_01110 [Bacilli bacterium]|nr:hypothetical protein [Bacilli bacterium]